MNIGKRMLGVCIATCFACMTGFAQLSAPPALADQPAFRLIALQASMGQGQSPEGAGERVLSIPVHLYIDSKVEIEIHDALGQLRFESQTLYPEGDREIRIGMRETGQGLYFVRVRTNWEELTEIITILQPR